MFFFRFSDEIFMTSFSNLSDKGVMERKRGREGKERGRDGDEEEERCGGGGERNGERERARQALQAA